MFIISENVMCELRARANLRNKTTSRGIWGYERVHKHPKAEISVIDTILARMYNKKGKKSTYLVV